MTDLKAEASEATLEGECDMGHLSDAIGDHNSLGKDVSAKKTLETVLSWHTDEKITLDWDPNLEDKTVSDITYSSDQTYQDVVEDIRSLVGGLAYFDEDNVLHMISPSSNRGSVDLTNYIINPEETSSLTGYHNVVVVIGYQSYDNSKTPGSEPIIATAKDQDSIDSVGYLIAPVEYAYNITSQAEADARATELLNFYKMYNRDKSEMQDCPYLQDCAYDHFKPYRHGGSRRILDNRKTLHTARMNWQQKITTSRPSHQFRSSPRHCNRQDRILFNWGVRGRADAQPRNA